MWDFKLCRVCLGTGASVKLISLNSRNRRDEFNSVSGLQTYKGSGLPAYLCVECYGYVRRFLKFRQKCHRANYTLEQMLATNKEIKRSHIQSINRRELGLMPFHTFVDLDKTHFECYNYEGNSIAQTFSPYDYVPVVNYSIGSDETNEFNAIDDTENMSTEDRDIKTESIDFNENDFEFTESHIESDVYAEEKTTSAPFGLEQMKVDLDSETMVVSDNNLDSVFIHQLLTNRSSDLNSGCSWTPGLQPEKHLTNSGHTSGPIYSLQQPIVQSLQMVNSSYNSVPGPSYLQLQTKGQVTDSGQKVPGPLLLLQPTQQPLLIMSNSGQKLATHSLQPSNTGQNLATHTLQLSNTGQNLATHSLQPFNTGQNLATQSLQPANTSQNLTKHSLQLSNTSQNLMTHFPQQSNTGQNLATRSLQPFNTGQNLATHSLHLSNAGRNSAKHLLELSNSGKNIGPSKSAPIKGTKKNKNFRQNLGPSKAAPIKGTKKNQPKHKIQYIILRHKPAKPKAPKKIYPPIPRFSSRPQTQEEQYSLVQNRKKSNNYLNSKFKCELCFRGYTCNNTYSKHMAKHDAIVSGKLQCDMCKLNFRNKRKIYTHMQVYHLKRYYCKLCKFDTTRRNAALSHHKWHKNVVYECSHCPEKFTKLTSRYTHVRLKHPSGTYICHLCGHSFVSAAGLVYHKQMSHAHEVTEETPVQDKSVLLQNPLFCADCDILFAGEDAFETHLGSSSKHVDVNTSLAKSLSVPCQKRRRRLIDKERKSLSTFVSQCSMCDVQLRNIVEGKKHFAEEHPGQVYYPYICNECGHLSSSNQNQWNHKRLHTNEKPYKCHLCEMEFRLRSNLKRHILVHTGEKNFTCYICGKCFTQEHGMLLHMKYVHLKVKRPPRIRRKKTSTADKDI